MAEDNDIEQTAEHIAKKKLKEKRRLRKEQLKKLAMEIPVELKIKSERNRMYGKWILRKAFEGKISKTLLWRDKTPMGDGSGSAGLIAFLSFLS